MSLLGLEHGTVFGSDGSVANRRPSAIAFDWDEHLFFLYPLLFGL